MKVLLAHEHRDSNHAMQIARRLERNDVEAYLSAVDTFTDLGSAPLSESIRNEMSQCSQLIVVVSAAAAFSWWIPLEIGIAMEKAYPIVSFALDNGSLPDYLRKWPYLQRLNEIDEYCAEAKRTYWPSFIQASYIVGANARCGAEQFHRDLKLRLGQ